MTQMIQIPNRPNEPNDSIDSNDSNDSMTGWQNAERYIWHYRLFLLDSEWSICPQFVWISIGTLAPYYRHLLIIIITPHLGKLKIGSWGGQSDYMTWNESSQIFHNHIEVPSPGWKHLLVIPHLWHYANVWLAKCFYVDSWKLHIDYGLCAGVPGLLTVG